MVSPELQIFSNEICMRNHSPRILYITRIWPRECGAHVRSLNILRALQQLGHVEVVGLEGVGSGSTANSDFEFTHTFRFELRPNRGLSEKIKWTVDPELRFPNGLAVEDEAVRRILPCLGSFDLVWFSTLHAADLDSATAIGKSAGERAVKRLNPRKVATRKVPVVFDTRIAGSLVGHLASSVNGSSIARKTSFLREKLGERIFAPGITIVDDPLRRRGLRLRAPAMSVGLESGRSRQGRESFMRGRAWVLCGG